MFLQFKILKDRIWILSKTKNWNANFLFLIIKSLQGKAGCGIDLYAFCIISDSSTLGLTVSESLCLSMEGTGFIMFAAQVVNLIVSVERILDYAKTEPEVDPSRQPKCKVLEQTQILNLHGDSDFIWWFWNLCSFYSFRLWLCFMFSVCSPFPSLMSRSRGFNESNNLRTVFIIAAFYFPCERFPGPFLFSLVVIQVFA